MMFLSLIRCCYIVFLCRYSLVWKVCFLYFELKIRFDTWLNISCSIMYRVFTLSTTHLLPLMSWGMLSIYNSKFDTCCIHLIHWRNNSINTVPFEMLHVQTLTLGVAISKEVTFAIEITLVFWHVFTRTTVRMCIKKITWQKKKENNQLGWSLVVFEPPA